MTEGKELTWRGVALGMSLTFIFTAANMYLGLKVGLTIATSIPAAVISMAFLGLFSGSNIRENNIVQTVCSAAGAMASVIFILPSLVIIGWWTVFPFWTSFLICAAGGVLGVLFTIPLRRALVTQSDLPYPEGVAAAEVLKVGADSREANPEAREGLLAVIYGALASAGLAIAVAMRLAVDSAEGYFRTGDLGRWVDDSYLVVTGRAKDIIIRNGENISPKEVEDILIGHPDIAEIAIVGLPDVRTGERACAVIVSRSPPGPDVASLGAFLDAQGIAKFKNPEQVVLWDALPKNDAGKVLKHQIRAALAAPIQPGAPKV